MSRAESTVEQRENLETTCLASLSELRDGEMMSVKPRGLERIALYHVGGCLYATQDACTHAQASLSEGFLDGERVNCPAHAAEFCIKTGEALTFPATEPLRVFRVWARDGVVYGDLRNAAPAADEDDSSQ